ncbi:T9SS type A sorting domain-containing protein [Flavobacterium sp. 83]|uniref:T9SS type A sorting domain-containing protein n=1 Tax=Flavobacterium sp. 83 TaxID=1131812 RepID=UPI00055838BF|nr:T9SS type A sorting domain-containing protein [Flavobacterium sp. 83]
MKTFLRKSAFLMIILFVANTAFGQATVTTDLLDYPPGATVFITGSGFQADESVDLQVIHTLANGDNDTSAAHLPWVIIADSSGNINSTWLVPFDEDELGATLLLTANGQSSGIHAEWTFTDANTSLSSPSPTTAVYGSVISFSSTLSQSGANGTCTLCVGNNNPIPGRTLDFSVNNGTSLGSTITNALGVATSSVSISIPVGNYNGTNNKLKVSFAGDTTPYAAQTATVNFNVTKASTSFSAITGFGIYGGSISLSANVNLNIAGLPIVFSLDGTVVGTGNTSASGVATLIVPFSSIPSTVNSAGVYTNKVSVSIVGTTNYSSTTGVGILTIGKAISTTVVTINGGLFTYTGSAQTPATVSVTGANLNATPTANYSNNTNAGTATASYAYAGDANHEASSDSKTFEIGKAASVTLVTINGGPFIYTGSAQTPATVSVTGANLSTTPTANYSNNTNAGTAAASYAYAGDANHEASADSKTFEIGKAASVTLVTINGGLFTYTGSAQTPATVSVTGANLSTTPTANYSNNTNAGTATASYAYAGDANHEASADSKTFEIGKAASATVVTINGGPFTYTGSAQTPAMVSVTGANLNASPTANYSNNTDAGIATASYAYAGDANHEASADSKTFEIGKAASVTLVTINGGPFTYTGSAQTPAMVSVTGANLNESPTANYSNNTNAGTATASYAYGGDANHEASADSKTFEIGKAASATVVTINGGPFTYTGSAQTPATVSVTGANLSATPIADYSNNTDAGTATASYAYAGDANHEASADSKTFEIGKAISTTVVTINGGPFIYTGSAQTPATVSVTGANLNESLTANYSNNTNAGTATASYAYAGDANHEASADSKTFEIGKAASATVVTINGGPFTYTGSAQTPATVSVTGANLNESLTANYSNNTNAGTATASYAYAGDANHEASADSKTFEIGKAASATVVTINGGPFTYTGSAQTPAMVSVTGANLNESPTANYSNNIDAGTATASYTYAGDANHEASADSKTFEIGKAISTTVVTINGGPFTYTGSAQTPATVSVTGANLSTTPTANYSNNTNAGTATASYAYAGDANHEASADSKNFEIGKAASVTLVTINGGPFTYTGSAQTPATVSVTGANLSTTPTANYSNNTNAGTATASYAYVGDANHEASSDSKTFEIGKAISTTMVTINGGPFTYTGSVQTPATVSVTGANLSTTPTADYLNNINAGTATATYAYAGDANHEASADSKNFEIGKAASATVVTINGGPFTYTGSAQTPAMVSVTGANLSESQTANYSNNTNAGTATASYAYGGDANHEASADSKTFEIGKAASVTLVTINGGPFTYTGSAQTPATVSVTGANLNESPTANYSNNTNAGTATASYAYAGDANHEASADSKTFEIGKAASVTLVTINGGPFTYTGSAQTPATVSVTGANLNESPTANYSNNTNAGTATASYAYAGDANHEASADSKNFEIGKAASATVVTINGGPFTYTGSAQTPAMVSVTGANLNESLTANYSNNTNAGTATASYAYAGDANHEASADSKTFEIGKAASATVVTINGGPFTYTGSAQTPATVSVTGANLSTTPTANYLNNINAGTATASYAYVGDANHEASADSKNFEIGKAASTVSVSGLNTFVYNGSAQGPSSAIKTGSTGALIYSYLGVSGTTYSASVIPPTNVGSYTVTATVLADANYNEASSSSFEFIISKAQLVVFADNKSKYCENLTLTGVISGVQGSDGITVTYDSTGLATLLPGTYPIIPVLHDPNNKLSNYSITSSNGVLTITIITVNLTTISPVPFNTTFSLTVKVLPVTPGISVTFYLDGLPKGTSLTNASGIATITIQGLPEEVYGVSAIAGNGCAISAPGFLPVYDPSKGFAAGNGSFDSPMGAYSFNTTCIAKARFGFSIKYKKGSTLPQGELDFQLKKNKMKFESTSFQWLVIAGNKSQFKGTGKINNMGTYNFIVTAIDNGTCEGEDEHDGDIDDDNDHHNGYDKDENHNGYHRDGKKCNDKKCLIPDQFRIVITTSAGIVVYDNQMGMSQDGYAASNITRGSIEINDTKITTKIVKNKVEKIEALSFLPKVYPNPSNNQFTIEVKSGSVSKVEVVVYDLIGRIIKQIQVNDGQEINFGEELPFGTYLAIISQGSNQKTVKLIKQ